MQHSKVLIIDDNPDVVKALRVLFLINDIECDGATCPEEGITKLQQGGFDLVIQDMNFTKDTTSGEEGEALYHRIRHFDPDLPIILLTAWTNLEMAVALIKDGAADYIAKPWEDQKLLTTVQNLRESYQLQQQQLSNHVKQRSRLQNLSDNFDLAGMVFADNSMINLVEMATQVAHSDAPILITGPNGAGKEKVAELIVTNSQYKDAPFIKVNAGALPADLIEAELFGAEAGAYTGATKAREGRFEAANGGTLFLDEIGNLPLSGQQKLLRVLQSGEFERVGSTKTRKVSVRIISATNTNLPQAIANGEFREDLYYRLNMIELKLPPLAQRKDDIPLLIQSFLDTDKTLSANAEHTLMAHSWPGNVRELQNVLGRAALLCQNNTIESKDLGITLSKVPVEEKVEYSVQDIQSALDKHQGIVAKAARSLGLSRQAFYRRMEKFGLK
jgi:DNA-binding NtrC family response regulator